MGAIAVSVSIQVAPRKPKRVLPVDVVRPEHEWIDDKLGAWGRWSRFHLASIRLGSAERAYRSPWRQWHYPSFEELMPAPPLAELRLIDRAVLHVPSVHQLALKLHYVFNAQPYVICRKTRIRPDIFALWMHDARAMTLNNLRLLESKGTATA